MKIIRHLTEESGVRDLALGDWARARILDGYWFSPADIWYQYSVPGLPAVVRAIHPSLWTQKARHRTPPVAVHC